MMASKIVEISRNRLKALHPLGPPPIRHVMSLAGGRRTAREPPGSKILPRNIKIGKMIGKLGNLLMFLAVVWPHQRPACLANWQTQFFFGRNSPLDLSLRR
jgi:hypothetical protein